MQNFKERKPYEYEGEMVMKAPKNPYSPSSGKSKMLSGSGYASSSGPYEAQVGNPYADRFDRSDANAQFEREIENIISAINNGLMDGKTGERQIFRLREGQQSAQNNYVRNAHQTRPQNPAKAQFNVYGARTGGPVTGGQLDEMYRNDAAMYGQLGGSPMGGSSRNPYLHQTAIDDARKPKFGASNWNY